MKKSLKFENILIICWIEVLLHTIRFFLRLYISIPLLDSIESILCASIIIGFALYYFSSHPKINNISIPLLLLFILFAIFIISCLKRVLLDGDNAFFDNAFELHDFQISILIFYLGAYYKNRSSILKSIIHIYLISISVAMLYVLVNVYLGRIIIPPIGGNGIGMINGIDFEISCNRNTVGISSMVLLLLCFSMIIWNNKLYLKLIYSFCTIVFYVAIILSSSRSALISSIIGVSSFFGVIVFSRYFDSKISKRLFLSVLAAIISGTIFFMLRYPVCRSYSYIVSNNGGQSFSAREMMGDNVTTLNNRTEIWKYAVKVITSPENVLTGVTPEYIKKSIENASNGSITLNTHNQILEVGISLGIPAMLIFIIWLLLIASKCIKTIKSHLNNSKMMLIPCILLSIVVNNLAETNLLFYDQLTSYIFFFLCGLMMNSKLENIINCDGNQNFD